MGARDPVLDSLERWHEEGLLDDATHQRLVARAEAEAAGRRSGHAARFVTGTGAVLLVAAFVVLTTVFWQDMTPLLRALFLWSATGVVGLLGWFRMRLDPVDRVGTALVAVAMPLSLGAAALTRQWRVVAVYDPVVVAALAVSAGLIAFLAVRFARHNVVLPAVGLAVSFFYAPVAAALLRVADTDPVVVALVALALAVVSWVTWALLARPDAAAGWAPGLLDGLFWVAFASLFALVPWVWFEVLDPYDGLDDWGPILSYAVLAAWAVGLGIRSHHNGVLILGSLMLIVDAWYLGIAKGEAIGTFLALFVSALVLFWLGHRLGFVGRGRDQGTGEGGAG